MTLAQIAFPSTTDGPNEKPGSGRFHGEFYPVDGGSAVESLLPEIAIEDRGQSGRYRWVRGGGFTFVERSLLVPDDDAVETVAREVYTDLFAFRAQQPHKHLLRFWNCVPHINRGAGDLEVYKRFCSGRLEGFLLAGLGEETFPAASALGHGGNRLTVHLLLGDRPGVHRANPLQVDAFQYPRQYGKSSPSFARATEVPLSTGKTLVWISGTASIRGHKTLHFGDVAAQTRVSSENIGVLLEQSGKSVSDIQSVRVYMRHPEDSAVIRAVVDETLPSGARVFLQADICREELLVEIECVAL